MPTALVHNLNNKNFNFNMNNFDVCSSIHKTPMAFDRLAPVVFESVHLEYVDCTYCEDQCFRDVTLSYKAQSSNPTGKSVRRTVSCSLLSVFP